MKDKSSIPHCNFKLIGAKYFNKQGSNSFEKEKKIMKIDMNLARDTLGYGPFISRVSAWVKRGTDPISSISKSKVRGAIIIISNYYYLKEISWSCIIIQSKDGLEVLISIESSDEPNTTCSMGFNSNKTRAIIGSEEYKLQ